ncbi:Ankyrin repeat protein [Planctomycetes bacterium MalM25]|nr:Ankyrin repeat protein [Planctomycetes bacterium MalM25]
MAAAGIGAKSVGEHPGTEEEVIEAIELLVGFGAAVDAVDKNNQTAMHGAAYRNYSRVVTRLADLGADPSVWNIKNHHGSTPEQIAQGRRPGSLKPSPETVAALQNAIETRSSSGKPGVLIRDR